MTPLPATFAAFASRQAKRCWNRGVDTLRRIALRGAAARRRLRIAAAVAGRFPVVSHTFAYQELLGLRDGLGADVKVFYQQDGQASARGRAFDVLVRGASRLPVAAEIAAADFARYRRRAPERVEALLAALGEASGLSLQALAGDAALARAFSFVRRVELWRPRWVHTYFFYEEALGGLAAQWLLGIPRGITAYADHMLDDWHLKVVPLHLRTADLVVATSRRVRDELVALGGDANRILVKPNGVDGRRFPWRDRAPAGPPLEVLAIARLEPKKGLLDLVDAVALLRRGGLDVRAHIVGGVDPGCAGSEEYAAEVHRRVERHGLGDTVILHGVKAQDALPPLLARARIFVAPYVETARGDKDGIPTAILEAMSTGLPVVATDAGSILEAVEDGVEGLIVRQHDAPGLARAIERLATDPELAQRLGRQAHARFAREFDAAVTEPMLHGRVRQRLTKP